MNILDLRDLIKEYETLEDDEERDEDDIARFKVLGDLFEKLRGYGGDEQWRGDWYPSPLIPEDEFEDYARELAEDLEGDAMRTARWPFNHIDWEAAAEALQVDYSSVPFDGTNYLYR